MSTYKKPLILPVGGTDVLSDETVLQKDAYRSIVNVDVSNAGVFSRRAGAAPYIQGRGFHSLYHAKQRNWVFVAKNNELFKLDVNNKALTKLCNLNSFDEVDYCEYNGNVYFTSVTSSGYLPSDDNQIWPLGETGQYDFNIEVIENHGAFYPGNYGITFVLRNPRQELSGSSRVYFKNLHHTSSFRISRLPVIPGYTIEIYITEPDGSELYLATTTPAIQSELVVSQSQKSRVCPTLHLKPLHKGHLIRWHNGRLFTAYHNKVYYSQPLRPHLYNEAYNFFELSGPVSILEPVASGIFIGDSRGVWFYKFNDPSDATVTLVTKNRAVYKSSTRTEASELNLKLVETTDPCAIWFSSTGVVVGKNNGEILEHSADRFRMSHALTGKSYVVRNQGIHQLLCLTGKSSGESYNLANNTTINVGEFTQTVYLDPLNSAIFGLFGFISDQTLVIEGFDSYNSGLALAELYTNSDTINFVGEIQSFVSDFALKAGCNFQGFSSSAIGEAVVALPSTLSVSSFESSQFGSFVSASQTTFSGFTSFVVGVLEVTLPSTLSFISFDSLRTGSFTSTSVTNFYGFDGFISGSWNVSRESSLVFSGFSTNFVGNFNVQAIYDVSLPGTLHSSFGLVNTSQYNTVDVLGFDESVFGPLTINTNNIISALSIYTPSVGDVTVNSSISLSFSGIEFGSTNTFTVDSENTASFAGINNNTAIGSLDVSEPGIEPVFSLDARDLSTVTKNASNVVSDWNGFTPDSGSPTHGVSTLNGHPLVTIPASSSMSRSAIVIPDYNLGATIVALFKCPASGDRPYVLDIGDRSPFFIELNNHFSRFHIWSTLTTGIDSDIFTSRAWTAGDALVLGLSITQNSVTFFDPQTSNTVETVAPAAPFVLTASPITLNKVGRALIEIGQADIYDISMNSTDLIETVHLMRDSWGLPDLR